MKAFAYLALMVLVLWVGVAWEQAHAPAPVVDEAVETPSPLQPSTSATDVEVMVNATEKALPASQEPAESPAAAPKQGGYSEAFVAALELAVHNRVNAERLNQGLKVLAYDEVLAEVAAYHSTDMAKEDYFAHEDEEGCDSACRVTSAGYKWRMVGENLFLLKRSEHFSAEGASAIVVAGWMGSPGHRKNLFEEDFTHQGIGVVIKGDSIYVTEVLTRPR